MVFFQAPAEEGIYGHPCALIVAQVQPVTSSYEISVRSRSGAEVLNPAPDFTLRFEPPVQRHGHAVAVHGRVGAPPPSHLDLRSHQQAARDPRCLTLVERGGKRSEDGSVRTGDTPPLGGGGEKH